MRRAFFRSLPAVRGSIPAYCAICLLVGFSIHATASNTTNRESILTASKRSVGLFGFRGRALAISAHYPPSYITQQATKVLFAARASRHRKLTLIVAAMLRRRAARFG